MKCISSADLKKQPQVTYDKFVEGGCGCDCYTPCNCYAHLASPFDCTRIKEIYGESEFNNTLNLATSVANKK